MRLIDADAFRTEFERIHSKHFAKSKEKFIVDTFKAVFKRIDKAPTVDAVAVVRCRDCKHCYLAGKAPFMYYACDIANGLGAGCKEDDFCSYGERKADNEPA